MPATTDATLYLDDYEALFEQYYRPGVGNMFRRHGASTKFIKMNAERRVRGKTMEVTVRSRLNQASRLSNDPLAAPGTPRAGKGVTYTVTFDHNDASSNDFMVLQHPFRTTHYDIEKRNDDTFKERADFIRQDIEEGLDSMKEKFVATFHRNSNGRVGVIATSGIVNYDDDRFDSATAYTSGSTEALVKLDRVAIAQARWGTLVDAYNTSGTLIISNLNIARVNPSDYTIVLETTADSEDSGGATVTNLDTLAAGHELFDSTERGFNPKGSLEEFFDVSTTYFGRDRATAEYAVLQPFRVDPSAGGSSVNLQADHFRQAGEVAGWTQGNFNSASRRMIDMNRDQYRALAHIVKDEGMTIQPALQSEIGRELNLAIGFDGFVLHDPTFGTIPLVVDDFHAYGSIDFLDMDTWEMVEPFPGGGNGKWIRSDGGGIWTRNTYNDGSGVPSKEYTAQYEMLYAWINIFPMRNIRLMGLTTDQ